MYWLKLRSEMRDIEVSVHHFSLFVWLNLESSCDCAMHTAAITKYGLHLDEKHV